MICEQISEQIDSLGVQFGNETLLPLNSQLLIAQHQGLSLQFQHYKSLFHKERMSRYKWGNKTPFPQRERDRERERERERESERERGGERCYEQFFTLIIFTHIVKKSLRA